VTGRTPLLLVAQNSTLGSAARRVGRQQAEDGRNDVRLQLHIVEGEEDFDFAQKLAPNRAHLGAVVCSGTEHDFAEHDEHAAAVLTQRVFALFGDE
jgi:hypothetical protein